MTAKIISYQGERGANSHIACQEVHPDWEPLPSADLRGRLRGRHRGRRLARDDPDREFGGRTGRRHPSPPAELGPAHRGRALPADPLPALRPEGSEPRERQGRLQPCPCARPMPQDHPQARASRPCGGRHGGLGARGRRVERSDESLARDQARGRNLRPRHPRRGRRGREAQHHPLHHPVEARSARALAATARP